MWMSLSYLTAGDSESLERLPRWIFYGFVLVVPTSAFLHLKAVDRIPMPQFSVRLGIGDWINSYRGQCDDLSEAA